MRDPWSDFRRLQARFRKRLASRLKAGPPRGAPARRPRTFRVAWHDLRRAAWR